MSEKDKEGILNDQEEAFVQAYMQCKQKAKAARMAGYSLKCSNTMGWDVYNRPHVKARIRKLVEESCISGEDAIKILSAMSEFNMADYMTPVRILQTQLIKIPIAELIIKKKEAYRREQLFLDTKKSRDIPKTRDPFLKEARAKILRDQELVAQRLRDEIDALEIEIIDYPNAIKTVKSEPVMVEIMQVDLKKLVKDKEKGKIKSFRHGKFGIEVEGYDARAAAVDIAKIHGKFEKHNEQSAVKIIVTRK